MPVFARTKLMIHDDCLSPVPYVTLSLAGPNPQRAYEYVKKLFVTLFKMDESEIQEREYSWDKSKGKDVFHAKWELIKDLDTFSFMHITVSLDGNAEPSKEFGKEGSLKLAVESRIRTEYPQETVWQRSLFYEMFRVFYHRVIYDETRKRYLENCRMLTSRFQEEMKAFFNLLPKMG